MSDRGHPGRQATQYYDAECGCFIGWRGFTPQRPREVGKPIAPPREIIVATSAQSRQLVLSCLILGMSQFVATALLGQSAQFEARPDLRIEGEFSLITSLAVSRNGNIAIAQPQDGTILFFDKVGKALGKFGRKGAGPGEFVGLARLGETQEGFWALDPLARRITELTASLTLGRIIPLPDMKATGVLPPFSFAAAALDGRLIVTGRPSNASRLSQFIAAAGAGGMAYVGVSSTGSGVLPLATIPSAPQCVVEGNRSAVAVPWCLEPLSDVSPRGQLVAMLLPTSRNFLVTCVRNTGDTVFSRTFEYTPVRIPTRRADSAFAHLQQGEYASARKSLPTFYPPVNRLVVGRDGTIWLEEHADGPEHHWLVLNLDGTSIGRVVLPRQIRLMAAERGTVWARERSPDDVESVVRYRIR